MNILIYMSRKARWILRVTGSKVDEMMGDTSLPEYEFTKGDENRRTRCLNYITTTLKSAKDS